MTSWCGLNRFGALLSADGDVGEDAWVLMTDASLLGRSGAGPLLRRARMALVEQTRVTPPKWVAWGLRACAVLVIAGCVAAWLGVDRTHHRALAEARATDAAVAATARLATQLQASIDALIVSTGSTGEAISHTVAISENVRALVTVVAGGNVTRAEADQLATVTNNLGDLEASLLETEGGLGETTQVLTDAQPVVDAAASTLQAMAEDARTGSGSQSVGGDGRTWWRVAITLTGVVLLTMLAALLAAVRRPRQV